ncbi:hypothetical protein T12_10780, partial [Trichinella patagoniensis]
LLPDAVGTTCGQRLEKKKESFGNGYRVLKCGLISRLTPMM